MTFRFEAGLGAEPQVPAHNGFFLERQPENLIPTIKRRYVPYFSPETVA